MTRRRLWTNIALAMVACWLAGFLLPRFGVPDEVVLAVGVLATSAVVVDAMLAVGRETPRRDPG